MKIQLKPELELRELGIDLTKAISSPLSQSIIKSLKKGEEEDVLANQVLGSFGQDGLTTFYFLLNLLNKNSLLIYKTALIDWIPIGESPPPDFQTLEGTYRISPFAILRMKENCFVMETPLYPVRINLTHHETLRLLDFFRKPSPISEVFSHFSHLVKEEVEKTLSLLQQSKFLTSDAPDSIEKQWEPHDLYFHSRTRLGRHDSLFGGHFPFRGKIPAPSSKKNYPSSEVFPLKRPDAQLPLSLEDAIETRRSIREHAELPLSSDQLGEFLFRCARVKESFFHYDEELSKRPYPGGGARYELEIYPVIYKCEGLQKGVYHYDPFEHCLRNLSDLNENVEKLLSDASHSAKKKEYPQILFVISARFQRVSWKYRSMAYALILKNLGALYQTMYLVATGMGLAPCALGGGNSDLFCKVMGTNYLEEASIGEFILGSRSSFV